MAWDGEESFGKMRCVSWTHLPLEQLESSGYDSVSQGLANYCLWPKSGLLPAFVHKALLKHSKSIHLHIICDCFHAIGISGLQSLKYLLSGPFKKKKIANSCIGNGKPLKVLEREKVVVCVPLFF